MKPVVVVLENSKGRESVCLKDYRQWQAVFSKLSHWMNGTYQAVQRGGVCKSFTVAIHIDAPDCDHEVPR